VRTLYAPRRHFVRILRSTCDTNSEEYVPWQHHYVTTTRWRVATVLLPSIPSIPSIDVALSGEGRIGPVSPIVCKWLAVRVQ